MCACAVLNNVHIYRPWPSLPHTVASAVDQGPRPENSPLGDRLTACQKLIRFGQSGVASASSKVRLLRGSNGTGETMDNEVA